MKAGRSEIVAFFKAGEFDTAIEKAGYRGKALEDREVDSIRDHFRRAFDEAIRNGDAANARRLRHRLNGFSAYCKAGFDPDRLLPAACMPEWYRGKILLLSVSGWIFKDTICLRSDDLHHRDILKNAELELQDLGLRSARVGELGGAWACSEPGRVRIWGGSDEFGPCDKRLAAEIIKMVYPRKVISIDA